MFSILRHPLCLYKELKNENEAMIIKSHFESSFLSSLLVLEKEEKKERRKFLFTVTIWILGSKLFKETDLNEALKCAKRLIEKQREKEEEEKLFGLLLSKDFFLFVVSFLKQNKERS